MITLPADRDVPVAKIECSVASFAGTVSGSDARYLLGLDEPQAGSMRWS